MTLTIRTVTLGALLGACGGKTAPKTETTDTKPAVTAGDGVFRYDAATGGCADSGGNAGFNAASPEVLFANHDEEGKVYPDGNGECVDFSGLNFGDHIGAGYPVLQAWNLRGAKFDGAKFVFANMVGVDLSGADLRGLEMGYTQIDGTGDEHTQIGDGCTVGEGFAIHCSR